MQIYIYISDEIRQIFKFIADNYSWVKHIHIYGPSMRLIKECIPFLIDSGIEIISIDSTKWTRAVTSELKKKYGLNCKNDFQRRLFFDEYLKKIRTYLGIKKIEY